MGVFKANLQIINNHNSDETKTFELAVNEYSDLSFDEFAAKFLGDDAPRETITNGDRAVIAGNLVAEINPKLLQLTPVYWPWWLFPLSWPANAMEVDWRVKNAVSPIKNQGGCGSCWAFAEVSAVESLYTIFKRTVLKNLSEQELVDCQTASSGCSGGTPSHGFAYIQSRGISYEASYPYVAANQACKVASPGTKLNTITGYAAVPVGPDALAAALRKRVTRNSLCVDSAFQHYSSGVYNPASCTCTGTNGHAVSTVGFNFNAATRYFIIKNSWGTSWGQQGFGNVIASSGNGLCGRFTNPSRTYYPYF
jgi:hypothetical protein